MSAGLDSALARAEAAAANGDFDAAAREVAAVAPELASADQPLALARAAWVAAICSLAGEELGDFSQMAQAAAEAIQLAGSPETSTELQRLARRISHLGRIHAADDPNTGVLEVVRSHVELLERAAGDPELWSLVDADRGDWPHLFAAVRSHTGKPCTLEERITGAKTDGVGAVILAVLHGVAPPITADALASLCFRNEAAVQEARARIDDFLESGVLVGDESNVRPLS